MAICKTKVFFWLKKKGIRWVSLRQRQANPVADHKRINHHILRWYTWITRVQRQENPATVFYCWSHLTRRTCKPVLSTMVVLSSVSSTPLSIPTPFVTRFFLVDHSCNSFECIITYSKKRTANGSWAAVAFMTTWTSLVRIASKVYFLTALTTLRLSPQVSVLCNVT